MELLLIRHALPETEVRNDGPADPPLSVLGNLQAKATADFLADETINAIVTSTMRRAMETSRPLAERLGLRAQQLDGLKESDHQRSSYTPMEDMDDDHEVILDYLKDPLLMFSDGYDAFRCRVLETFDNIVASHCGQTVAVYCHSMVVSVYLQTLLGHDDPFALLCDYCGISRVSASTTGIRTVRSINETAHLRQLASSVPFN
ncbi:MAG: histidine phosphatase family protein [Acidimicrobiales bacterium]|nr:histidine phosphatase family protein [Acidimicrobiales bacterium]